MRILWDNLLDDYTPTASTEAAGYPATNAQQQHLSQVWRTTGLAAETFAIDAGAGNTITCDCAFVAGHNLTSGVNIHVQACNDGTYAAPTVDEHITYRAGTMCVFFASIAARYWRFIATDAGNTDGYIAIGRLALGAFLQMPPVEPGVALPLYSSSLVQQSVSGQSYGDKGKVFQRPAFTFPIITSAEKALIDVMFRAVDQVYPVFLVIWEDSLTAQGPIYCRINQDTLDWKKAPEAGLSYSVDIEFMEEF